MIKKISLSAKKHPRIWEFGTISFMVLPIFIIYLRTLAPTVFGLDSAELTTGAYTLGIIHAPGAPLYLLLAHLFTYLPFGDVGYRVNMFSAICGVVSSALFFLLLRQFIQSKWIAILVTFWLAFTYYFWISALAAELYAPAGTFYCLILYLAVRWSKDPTLKKLCLLTFVCGLGLGVHLMLVLAIPGLAWMVLDRYYIHPADPKPTWMEGIKKITLGMFCGLLGTSIYLYLPIRYLSNAGLNYARDYWQVNLASWDGFWWMITGQMFSGFMFSTPIPQIIDNLINYSYQLTSSFTLLGVILGGWGLFLLFKRSLTLAITLLAMFLGHLFFYLPYNVSDKDLMFLPTYLIWGVWVGVGVNECFKILSNQLNNLAGPLVVYGGLVAIIMVTMAMNYPLVDLSQDWSARQNGEEIMDHLERDAWFFGTWSDVPILEYLQVVELKRTDLTFRNLFFTGSSRALNEARQQAVKKIPVYTSNPGWFSSEHTIQVPLLSADLKLYRVGYTIP